MQRADEFAEFVIDGDSQRLEDSRRRVSPARLLAHEAGDELGELPRRRDAQVPPRLDDRARHGPRPAFFAIVIEDVGEFRLRRLVHEVGRADALALHPHVEGAVLPERKPALGLIELHRGDPDVEDDTVGAGNALRRNDFFEVPEPPRDKGEPALLRSGELRTCRDRFGIAVDGDEIVLQDGREGSREYSRRHRKCRR